MQNFRISDFCLQKIPDLKNESNFFFYAKVEDSIAYTYAIPLIERKKNTISYLNSFIS